MSDAPWRATPDGVVVACRLTPKGGRDAIDGAATLADGTRVLLVRVRAVPENGKANDALMPADRRQGRRVGVARAARRRGEEPPQAGGDFRRPRGVDREVGEGVRRAFLLPPAGEGGRAKRGRTRGAPSLPLTPALSPRPATGFTHRNSKSSWSAVPDPCSAAVARRKMGVLSDAFWLRPLRGLLPPDQVRGSQALTPPRGSGSWFSWSLLSEAGPRADFPQQRPWMRLAASAWRSHREAGEA